MERTAPDGAAPPWAPCTRSQLPPQSLDRHSPSVAPAKRVRVVTTGAADAAGRAGVWANAKATAPAASSGPPSATAARLPFIDPPPFTGPARPHVGLFSSGEVGTEAGGGLARLLGDDPHAAHHAHEVGVAGPPRHRVKMDVVGDPGPRGPAEVHADVHAVG